jgi:hypothetical protein
MTLVLRSAQSRKNKIDRGHTCYRPNRTERRGPIGSMIPTSPWVPTMGSPSWPPSLGQSLASQVETSAGTANPTRSAANNFFTSRASNWPNRFENLRKSHDSPFCCLIGANTGSTTTVILPSETVMKKTLSQEESYLDRWKFLKP